MYNGTDHTAGWDNSGGAGHTHTVSSTGMLDTGQYTHVSGHTACTPSVNNRHVMYRRYSLGFLTFLSISNSTVNPLYSCFNVKARCI